jgi:hypothetical protein
VALGVLAAVVEKADECACELAAVGGVEDRADIIVGNVGGAVGWRRAGSRPC